MGTRLLGTRLAAVAGVLLLSGCAGDDSNAAPADPTASGTTASSSPAPAEETTDPRPTPASGPRLDGGDVSIQAPEGWVRADSLMDFIHVAEPRRGLGDVQLAETPGTSTGATTDQLARIALDTSVPDNARRLPDVTFDGVDFYHVAGSTPSDLHVTEYGADHLGRFVTVKFNLDHDIPAAERRAIIASVMASLRWS